MSLSSILSAVQTQMNRYLCPTALTFGIAGSLLNILLFSQKQYRNNSCCICKSTVKSSWNKFRTSITVFRWLKIKNVYKLLYLHHRSHWSICRNAHCHVLWTGATHLFNRSSKSSKYNKWFVQNAHLFRTMWYNVISMVPDYGLYRSMCFSIVQCPFTSIC